MAATRILSGLLWVSVMSVTEAAVFIDGQLTATGTCPAVSSIKRGENPGNVQLESGRTYPVLGKNKEDATHLLVRVQGAKPDSRWVEVSCGTLNAEPGPAKGMRTPVPNGQFMLAASWLPAFCEVQQRRPECRGQISGSQDAGRFSLHGLWPQPSSLTYCGLSAQQRERAASARWDSLPPLALSDPTRQRLDVLMPGSRSYLHRHQWAKHGTCYGASPDAYFQDSMRLLEQLNKSDATALFARSVGRHLSATEVRRAFDASFGPGAGQRVRLVCDDGMISELRISLRGR